MSETVAACPECDSSRVSRNAVGGVRAGHSEPQGRYRCAECAALFNDIVERERYQPDHRPKGLAGELAAASAEEVGDEYS